MFTECEQWRKDFEVDEIARSFKFEENPLVTSYYPRYYHKTDKVNFHCNRLLSFRMADPFTLSNWAKLTSMPCTRLRLRNVFFKTLSTSTRSLQILVWYLSPFCFYCGRGTDVIQPACSRKAGKLIETSCTIMDLQGIGLRSATQVYGYLQEASKIGQNYYPERMGTNIIQPPINCQENSTSSMLPGALQRFGVSLNAGSIPSPSTKSPFSVPPINQLCCNKSPKRTCLVLLVETVVVLEGVS